MYCKYCGKKLNNKKCDCEDFKNNYIDFNESFSLIIDLFKKPSKTVSDYVTKGDSILSIIMLLISTFLNSLLMLIISNGFINRLFINIQVDNLKMFVIVYMVELFILGILTLITYFVSFKILSNQKGSIKNVLNLISICSLVIGIPSLISILFYFIFDFILYDNIVLLIILFILLASSLMFILLYYGGLKKTNNLDYNKNCYVTIISLLATLIIVTFISNLIKIEPIKSDNYNDHHRENNYYNEIWW